MTHPSLCCASRSLVMVAVPSHSRRGPWLPPLCVYTSSLWPGDPEPIKNLKGASRASRTFFSAPCAFKV